jgi:antitoxin component YwqK of YwqJK toxin-antitoxin module
MKSILLSALFLMMSQWTFAQNENDKKAFLDSLGRETTSDYKYFRIIKNYNFVQDEYQFEDYYKSGSLKMRGMSISNKILIENGGFTFFHENGNLQQIISYENGLPLGSTFTFYENGKKKFDGEYLKNDKNLKLAGSLKIESYWNQDNKQTVINGNGFFKDETTDETSEGNLQNGLKNSVWKGKSATYKLTFIESYENGTLVSGESTDEKGEKYKYDKIFEPPIPTKGFDDFYKFVGDNFRIPEDEEINVRLLISFVINKDASISNVNVVKSINPALDNEGIRIVKLYKNWGVGKFRGVIVRTSYTIPIKIVF